MSRNSENHSADVHLSGVVDGVRFRNDENGYTVLQLNGDTTGEVIVVGTFPELAAGERLEMDGHWESHPKFGDQFKAELIMRYMPEGSAAIRQYLGSGIFRGVRAKLAGQIVDRFGDQTLEVIEREPERLAELKGVSMGRAMAIGAQYRKRMGMRLLADFINQHQLPVSIVAPLYQRYADNALEEIRANPYILVEKEFGCPFRVIDEMAIEQGIDADNPLRVNAAILHELNHNADLGHVFIPWDKLVEATMKLISVEKDAVEQNLQGLIDMGEVAREWIMDRDACYSMDLYRAETMVAMRIAEMCTSEMQVPKALPALLNRIQMEQGIDYAQQQLEAVELAATRQVMLLTGGPGTGKTTTLRGILSLFEHLNLKVSLAAPTGRAAKRMTETCGKEASTIHRLLQMAPDLSTGELVFTKNQDDPLEADAVIVDEASMIDMSLMASLLAALRGDCRLVLVGDPDQLPSVGPGSVLDHLIRSEVVPTITLTEIFRQAQASDIVMNAHGVNQGRYVQSRHKDRKTDFFIMVRQDPEAAIQTVVELCSQRLPKNMGIPANEIQVLSPAKTKGACTKRLNQALQEALNPPAPTKGEIRVGDVIYRVGDRVMQTRNDYDLTWENPATGETDTGVFNGDIGVITEVTTDGVTVSFDGRMVTYIPEQVSELDPAYAVTVHKAQGSEFRAVVLVACGVPYNLQVRSVLYTGITRARETLILVGDPEQFNHMVDNNRPARRYTALRVRLRNEMGIHDEKPDPSVPTAPLPPEP